jgi:hypothetical protein
MRRNARAFLLGIGLTGVSLIASAQQVFMVNCAAGETINGALARGDSRKQMTIQVSGTCTENVVIARDDVTLVGMPAAVTAADGGMAAIQVRGSRVTIIGPVEVTGGVNAIGVNGHFVVIQNATLQGATQSGLNLSNSSVTANRVRITNNGVAGILLRGGHLRLTESEIFNNATGIGINAMRNASVTTVDNTISGNLKGVVVELGSTASLDGDAIGPNAERGLELATGSSANLLDVTISGNGAGGVLLDTGSTATISGGTIGPNGGSGIALESNSTTRLTGVTLAHNGTQLSHHGIGAAFSQVSIEGGSITQSAGRGMDLYASSAELSAAEIINNGRDGIRGRVGSTVAIYGGSISNNGGYGVLMVLNGTLNTASGPVIKGNSSTEIRLESASKLLGGYIDANDGVGLGLDCQDGESSWSATLNGSVGSGCTGY